MDMMKLIIRRGGFRSSAVWMGAIALTLAWARSSVMGAELTFRLVRAEAPQELVSSVVTDLSAEAEAAKARELEEKAQLAAMAKMGQAQKASALKDDAPVARAEFDRYTNYMRGIFIDKKLPFYKSYQGSYLGRSDVITLDLPDGEHTIDPGAHKFTVKGDKVTTSDPTLKVAGTQVDVMAFPVTIMAVDGSAVRDLPAEVRRLPVSPRLFQGEEELLPKEQYLSATATFKRLTLYMLGNETDSPYRISPGDRLFHVRPEGIEVLDAAGRATGDKGATVEDRFTLILPQIRVPVTIHGDGINLVISGPSGRLSVETPKEAPPANTKIKPIVFEAIGAAGGADITVGKRAGSESIRFIGDVGDYPRRRIVVDATDPRSKEPRAMLVAFAGYSGEAGKTIRVRIQSRDAMDAATITPTQVAAYLWQEPVLGDDGVLSDGPEGGNDRVDGWRSLRVSALDVAPGQNADSQADWFDVHLPVVPSNVYRIRFVVAARGEAGPMSALYADFVEGVINPDSRANLTVFCPVGRHAYLQGEDMSVDAVIKSTVAVPAGTLTVTMQKDGASFTLLQKAMPALDPGEHPVHFVLSGSATAAISEGEYRLVATMGALASNHWSVTISRPQFAGAFPYFDVGWDGVSNIETGRPYINVPHDIAQANQKRALLHRNARIQGPIDNINFTDHTGFVPLVVYQGRDSSSEVAEAEMILRSNLSLPAHEAYYYQNNYEMVHEVLVGQGMGLMNELVPAFSPISLIHTVEKEVNAVNRQFQLTVQIARKFPNMLGIATNKELTIPTGNSEVVDQGRTVRLIEYQRKFVERHGFDIPSNHDALEYFMACVTGSKITPPMADAGKRWEAWFEDLNDLQGNWYGFVRKNVDPIWPGLALPNLGPGWGDSFSGLYPPRSHRNQSPLLVQVGAGDYGEQCMLDSFWKTKMFSMTGQELWGEQGMFGTAGPASLKIRMIGFLAAGAKGYGYRCGWGREGNDPRDTYVMTWMKDRLDDARFLREYGAMFRQIEPRGEIGIYYPFRQAMYEVMSPRVVKDQVLADTFYLTIGAITQLAFDGYNADIVTDEMIDAGEDMSRFKVMILPELHYTSDKYMKALEKFVQSGGTILAGSESTLLPRGARKIDDNFMEAVETEEFWGYNGPMDVSLGYLLREARRKAPILKAEMEKSLKPFAEHATDRVFVQTSRAGDGRVTFVWDFLYPSWMGTTRVSGNVEWSAFHSEANESTLMPVREKISFPAQMATYDLVTRERIGGAEAGGKDGRVTTVADLSFTPFRIYVSLPREIASLRVEAPTKVDLGSHFPIKVSPVDSDGKEINASIPIRITLVDQDGKEVWRVNGAALGTYAGELSAALGQAAGEWRIVVEELVSGRKVEVRLSTSEPGRLPFGRNVVETPTVDVQRGDLVCDFVEARKQDHAPVLILLDESQVVKWKPVAEEARMALAAVGVESVIRLTSEHGVFETSDRVHLYKGWTELKPDQYIDKHVVLIGGEGQSVLIEEIQDNNLFLRPLTQSYPGPGRGVISLVRSAFAFNKDVLAFMGPDVEGVRAAVAKLGDVVVAGRSAGMSRSAAGEKVAWTLACQTLTGTIQKGTAFASMDGAVVQTISTNADASRIAFGASAYGKNVFVFDAAGKPALEDKIGHVNTQGVTLLPGADGGIVVDSDGWSYLRKADGSLAWGAKGVSYTDPAGRFFVLPFARGFAVYDLSLKLLWQFDEWSKYETTREILFARQATFLTTADAGSTVVFRIAGREPGVGGKESDEVVFADAMTGKEIRRATVDVARMLSMANMQTKGTSKLITMSPALDGRNFIAEMGVPSPYGNPMDHRLVLLDQDMKPLQVEQFPPVTYVSGIVKKANIHLLSDKRLVYTVGDTLCVSSPDWTSTRSIVTSGLILSLAVDESKGRIATSNYYGDVDICDLSLKPAWRAQVETAAQLKWLPNGSLAVGTLKGEAMVFDGGGQKLWSASLNRFSEPDAVEARWTEIEALPTIQREGQEPWWERIAKAVPLGDDIAKVSGVVAPGRELTGQCDGEAFGTYLVEWSATQAAGSQDLSLEIIELEGGPKGSEPKRSQRITQSIRTGARATTQRAVLCLGDKPIKVEIKVRCAGSGEASAGVSIRQLMFPSTDIARISSLYRGEISEADRANPPANVDLYFNVTEEDQPHVTVRVDPFSLINGRRLETEKSLKEGRWFGNGFNNYGQDNAYPIIPCWIELTFPRKQVVTHVAIAEDPTLPRVRTLSIDAFIESRENRQGLSEFEKRQVSRGFFLNVVKKRGGDSPYNVYKLEKPVFTRKLRIYVLEGMSSINEVEVYGALEKHAEAK